MKIDEPYLEGYRPRKWCALYKSGNQTISNATQTAVTWDMESGNKNAEDLESWFDTGVSTSKVYLTESGLYLIEIYLSFPPDASPSGTRYGRIYHSRTGDGPVSVAIDHRPHNGTDYCQWTMSALTQIPYLDTDYIELNVYQSSGNDLALDGGGEDKSHMRIIKLL